MAVVYNFFKGVFDSIPVIVRKVGSFIIFIFALGMCFGYFIVANASPIVLLFPFISMAVMWHDLDQGVLIFILLIVVAVLFPELIPVL